MTDGILASHRAAKRAADCRPGIADAVAKIALFRMAGGDHQLTNPRSGEVITILNSGGDTEVQLPTGEWMRALSCADARGRNRRDNGFEAAAARSDASRLRPRLEAVRFRYPKPDANASFYLLSSLPQGLVGSHFAAMG